MELITNQELIAIQTTWQRDMNLEYTVSFIYNTIYERPIEMKKDKEKLIKEEELLKSSCKNPDDFLVIQGCLELLKSKALLNRKHGLKNDIEKRIEKAVVSAS